MDRTIQHKECRAKDNPMGRAERVQPIYIFFAHDHEIDDPHHQRARNNPRFDQLAQGLPFSEKVHGEGMPPNEAYIEGQKGQGNLIVFLGPVALKRWVQVKHSDRGQQRRNAGQIQHGVDRMIDFKKI